MTTPPQVEITRISVPPLLTAPDLARVLKVSPATAYRLMERGEIDTVRMGRSIRVTMKAVDEFIARRTVRWGEGCQG